MKKIIIGIVCIGILGGLYVWMFTGEKHQVRDALSKAIELENIDTPPEDASVGEDDVSKATVSGREYANETYGFGMTLPVNTTAQSVMEGDGETILVQSQSGGEHSADSLQISVSPFDEDISLTPARVQKDVPSLKMETPMTVKVDGVSAVAFYSRDGDVRYREVWFVHGGFLYQVLARAEADNTTGKVMESWKWKK